MGSCQNFGPFLGTLNNRCRIIIGTQKGTIILTTTDMPLEHDSCKIGLWILMSGLGLRSLGLGSGCHAIPQIS